MFSSPSQIRGKWHGNEYIIKKELGRGANGIVYLVAHQNHHYALKLGEDTFSISSEVNVLKHFEKAQGRILGPSVYDVDDWQAGSVNRPFYVMNVIEGIPLHSFIKQRGREWIPVFISQVLGFLDDLHKQGWAFGDLKPDNLNVSANPPQIAWFDAGGITKMGRAIKEYTESFDRGHWQMGNRKAEASYDLFSVAMIFLALYLGEPLQAGKRPVEQLKEAVLGRQEIAAYQQLIWKALSGQYQTALEMKQDLLVAWHSDRNGQTQHQRRNTRHAGKPASHKPVQGKRSRFLGNVISFFFISSFIIFLLALYLFSQTM